ncbi:lipopolysaccharide biosynthesis protein [Nocardioides sp.]|uniref:lipopolysaccharide biosynthesis protein n=1 Tax=Nocardioides sp. TaxID=35761 RepID=UPI002D7F13E9|nr:oligosaccharide flippase family protein [Nocardioides sp.]HET8961172.1 oligosaccharide flippase family protein [Nocardioides sp.]
MRTHGPRSLLRDTSALALGSVVSGLLAYVFFALVTRALGPVPAAPVSVLWAWWSFAGAALTFPLQHWITRSVTVHEGEWAVRRALGGVILVVVIVGVVAGAGSWWARDLLFHRSDAAFPALVVAVALGSGAMGIVRGLLAARRRFPALGAALVAENALRCVAALALMVAGVDDPVAYGLSLVAGYLAIGFWPSTYRIADTGNDVGAESPLAFVTGASVGQLLGQVVLTGGPVLLAAAGGAPAEVTALFAGLALFRAPYTLALGLVSQLTERLTVLVVRGRREALRRFRIGVVLATLGAAVVGAAAGYWAGPPLMELIFGEGVRLPGGLTLLIAVGTVFALANLVLTVTALARGRTGALVRAWVVAAVPGALVFWLSPMSALDRATWTFTVVEAAAFCWLVAEDVRSGAGDRDRSGLLGAQEDR